MLRLLACSNRENTNQSLFFLSIFVFNCIIIIYNVFVLSVDIILLYSGWLDFNVVVDVGGLCFYITTNQGYMKLTVPLICFCNDINACTYGSSN